MRIVRCFAAVSRLFAGGHPERLVTVGQSTVSPSTTSSSYAEIRISTLEIMGD